MWISMITMSGMPLPMLQGGRPTKGGWGRRLILDLRDNGGGSLKTVVEMAGYSLKMGLWYRCAQAMRARKYMTTRMSGSNGTGLGDLGQ